MYLFIFCSLFSFTAEASLRAMLDLTLKRNLQVEQARVNMLQRQQDQIIIDANYSTKLQLESSFLDSDFERDPFSLVDANTAWSHELTLAKPFSWGGELSLSNTHRSLSPKSSLPESYLFEQRISYVQDFGKNLFGNAFKAQVNATQLESEVAKLELTRQERDQILTVAKLYIEAAGQVSLQKLEEEALDRAKKRLSYVSKQVRDGLRERVDGLRSQENLLARESALYQVQERLWQLREEAALLTSSNVGNFKFNANGLEEDWIKPWQGWHLKENVDRQLLLKRLETLRERARTRKVQDFADVKLITSYGTNNWELRRSQALSQGRLGQDTDQWSVALQVSMPWGNDAAKAEAQKVAIEQQMLRRYQENWSEVLIQTARTLGERHKILAKNLEVTIERVGLAKKALEAYNSLYAKGRVNLEQVITAEEQLILDEKLVISSRQSLATLTLEAQALAGRLVKFLYQDVDL